MNIYDFDCLNIIVSQPMEEILEVSRKIHIFFDLKNKK